MVDMVKIESNIESWFFQVQEYWKEEINKIENFSLRDHLDKNPSMHFFSYEDFDINEENDAMSLIMVAAHLRMILFIAKDKEPDMVKEIESKFYIFHSMMRKYSLEKPNIFFNKIMYYFEKHYLLRMDDMSW